MEHYTQMKKSGVTWVQEIPVNWGIRVLFQLVDQVKNKNKDLSEQNLLSLSYGKIKRKDINNPEGLLPESFDGYNIIEANDIVLRLTDLQNDHTSLRVGQAKERGIITSAYTTLRPSGLVNPQYLYYALHAYDLIKGFYGMGSGVRQGLNYDEVKSIKIPFPPIEEQSRIVDYLDEQVIKIDSIISEAKQSIDDYKQWKNSLTFQVLKNGLHSDVPTKNSGIEWVGEIPSHWTIYPAGYLFEEVKEKNKMKLDLPPMQFKYGEIIEKKGKSAEADGETLSAYTIVAPNDVMINGLNLNYDFVTQRVAIVNKRGIITSAYLAIRPNEKIIIPRYAMYLLKSYDYKRVFHGIGSGIRKTLKFSDFRKIHLQVPQKEEQKEIVDYLDDKCKKIDEVISEKEKLAEELESYKRSVIYEVVTGKRKVV